MRSIILAALIVFGATDVARSNNPDPKGDRAVYDRLTTEQERARDRATAARQILELWQRGDFEGVNRVGAEFLRKYNIRRKDSKAKRNPSVPSDRP